MLGLIGLITGATIGMTGAGGALIAIPLFIALLGSTLQDATILSLGAVSTAAAFNLVLEGRMPDLKTALSLSVLGSIASALALPLKPYLPASITAGLILILVLAGLKEVWGPPHNSSGRDSSQLHPGTLIIAGLILGVVTAVTGLGGGVLLVPLLLRLTGQSYEEVIPTGLLTIFLISSVTLGLQIDAAVRLLTWNDLTPLLFGTVVAGAVAKRTMRLLKQHSRLRLRQVTFTLVALVAAANIIQSVVR